jgi:hypothetical protein
VSLLLFDADDPDKFALLVMWAESRPRNEEEMHTGGQFRWRQRVKGVRKGEIEVEMWNCD